MPEQTTLTDESTETDTPTQTTTPSSSSLTSDNWRDHVPKELKDSPALRDYKKLEDVFKSHVELQGKIGQKGIIVPADNAKPEEWDAFYKTLGRPEKPDAYRLPTEDVPKIDMDEAVLGSLKKAAFDAGVSEKAFAKMYRAYMNTVDGQMKAQDQQIRQQMEQQDAELKKEWGNAFDERLGLARKAVNTFLDEKERKWLEESGMHDNPNFKRMFAKIGKALASDEILGSGAARQFALTPSEAANKISELNMDKEFMKVYTTPNVQGHDDAVKRMNALYEMAYGGGA